MRFLHSVLTSMSSSLVLDILVIGGPHPPVIRGPHPSMLSLEDLFFKVVHEVFPFLLSDGEGGFHNPPSNKCTRDSGELTSAATGHIV